MLKVIGKDFVELENESLGCLIGGHRFGLSCTGLPAARVALFQNVSQLALT
jgi:hypothetical protein